MAAMGKTLNLECFDVFKAAYPALTLSTEVVFDRDGAAMDKSKFVDGRGMFSFLFGSSFSTDPLKLEYSNKIGVGLHNMEAGKKNNPASLMEFISEKYSDYLRAPGHKAELGQFEQAINAVANFLVSKGAERTPGLETLEKQILEKGTYKGPGLGMC